MNLADLLADPARVAELEPEQARALLPQLGGLVVLLSARLATAGQDGHGTNGGDKLLTPEEAAAIANTTAMWIWRRSRRADWQKFVTHLSRKCMRIHEAGFRAWLAKQGTRA